MNTLEDSDNYEKISKEAKQFELIQGRLYMIPSKNRKKAKVYKLLAIPDTMVATILKYCHDKGGHFGIHKTISLIRKRFWWKTIVKDVTAYCKSCPCMLKKYNSQNAQTETRHIFANKKWDKVAIDWVEIGRQGKYGNNKCLTIIDLFDRFVIAFPAKDKSFNSLKHILQIVFGLMG